MHNACTSHAYALCMYRDKRNVRSFPHDRNKEQKTRLKLRTLDFASDRGADPLTCIEYRNFSCEKAAHFTQRLFLKISIRRAVKSELNGLHIFHPDGREETFVPYPHNSVKIALPLTSDRLFLIDEDYLEGSSAVLFDLASKTILQRAAVERCTDAGLINMLQEGLSAALTESCAIGDMNPKYAQAPQKTLRALQGADTPLRATFGPLSALWHRLTGR